MQIKYISLTFCSAVLVTASPIGGNLPNLQGNSVEVEGTASGVDMLGTGLGGSVGGLTEDANMPGTGLGGSVGGLTEDANMPGTGLGGSVGGLTKDANMLGTGLGGSVGGLTEDDSITPEQYQAELNEMLENALPKGLTLDDLNNLESEERNAVAMMAELPDDVEIDDIKDFHSELKDMLSDAVEEASSSGEPIPDEIESVLAE